MACSCTQCVRIGSELFGSVFASPKEDQKAKVGATPVLKPIDQSFESRVVALAETLYDNKRATDFPWKEAIKQASGIVIAADSIDISLINAFNEETCDCD